MSEQKEAQGQQEQDQSELEAESKQSDDALESPSATDKDSDPESTDTPPRRRGGNVMAWVALVLALAAASLAGWQWWLSRTGDETGRVGSQIEQQAGAIDSQSRRVSELGERMDAVETRLDELAGRLDARDFDPAALRNQIQSQSDSDVELRQRVSSLSQRIDQAVADLESQLEQARSARSDRIDDSLTEARFRLGLVEIAGLLRLGQSQAELAADPVAAIAAYRLAQSRLEAIEDGRVARLRQLIARELEALRAIDTTDWPALARQLATLEAESAQWLPAGIDAPDAEEVPTTEAGEAADGWWSSVRASLGGLIRVTPREAAPLTPAALESVRERLRLHLSAAQAAAARRGTEEMVRHLEVAADIIRAHFDTSTEPVSRALESISDAVSVDSPSLPDLGGALAEAERRLAGS